MPRPKLSDEERRTRHRARIAAGRAAHPEWQRRTNANYYAAHRTQELARRAAYRTAHPEQVRATAAARIAAISMRRRLLREAKARGCLVCQVWYTLTVRPCLGCPNCGLDSTPQPGMVRLEGRPLSWVG